MFEHEPGLDEPTFSEMDGVRYLHFGTPWVQGAMRLRKPSELVLEYTQQMMAWLLFLRPGKRDRMAVLGLGAGALLRYVLRHTPMSVETIERNPQVFAACAAYFRLPQSARSALTEGDAGLWVLDPAHHDRHAVVLVDLYDAWAEGPVCSSAEFYRGCRQCLAEGGVMVVNLFGHHDSYAPNIRNILDAFDGRVLQLPETVDGNRIVLGFTPEAMRLNAEQLLARAGELEQQLQLPASRWARELLDTARSRPRPDALPALDDDHVAQAGARIR